MAEKLGRKWIVSDLGKFAIHTTRKRMIGVQRQLKAEGKDYRAFEILNLGKYERQHYIGVNPNLREGTAAAAARGEGSRVPGPDPARLPGGENARVRHLPRQAGRAIGGDWPGQPAGDAVVR